MGEIRLFVVFLHGPWVEHGDIYVTLEFFAQASKIVTPLLKMLPAR